MTNWKTTLAGVSAILTALADIGHSLSVGYPINWAADMPAIIGGVGLILAKDATTHSTVEQVQAATDKAKV